MIISFFRVFVDVVAKAAADFGIFSMWLIMLPMKLLWSDMLGGGWEGELDLISLSIFLFFIDLSQLPLL